MIQGLHNSVSSALVQKGRMSVISNNLANVNTNSFKKEIALFQSRSAEPFENPEVQYRSNMRKTALGGGVFMSHAWTDHEKEGAIQLTNNRMDLRIEDPRGQEGQGFFRLENADQEVFYKRSSNFIVNQDNFVTDETGKLFLTDTRGNKILIDPETVSLEFDKSRQIIVDGEITETVRMSTFKKEDLQWMKKIGDNLYQPLVNIEEAEFEGKIHAGSLEGSNVKMVEEMAEMIQSQRNYELNMKMISMQDQSLERAISQVGNIQV